jgi:hypothetical protein
VYAVGAGGVILTINNGVWEPMVSGVTEDLFAISGRDGGTVWAVGENGVALRLDGTAWKVEQSQPVGALGGVFVYASDRVFAAGTTGGIIRFQR